MTRTCLRYARAYGVLSLSVALLGLSSCAEVSAEIVKTVQLGKLPPGYSSLIHNGKAEALEHQLKSRVQQELEKAIHSIEQDLQDAGTATRS